MKKYDVKYVIGDPVYVLLDKKIFSSKIESIEVRETKPYIELVKNEYVNKDGISVKYLVLVKEVKYETGGSHQSFDWYDQDQVFNSKEELIHSIN